MVRDQIIEVKKPNYFSVLVAERKDISHKQQLHVSVVIRLFPRIELVDAF